MSISCETDIETNLVYQTVGWDDCPAEILSIIFEKLDITSLRCCLWVSRRWKESAEHICGSQGLWQDVVEDGIVNHGVTQRCKSLLSWRDLYFNSLLWSNIQLATVNKTQELEMANIKNIHVYEDTIIIVNTTNVEYYKVDSLKCVRVLSMSCEDFQESDNMILVATHGTNNHYKLTLFAKCDIDYFENVQNHFNGVPFIAACKMFQCWKWVMYKDSCYFIDWRHVVWRLWEENRIWKCDSLARYYGGFQYSMENAMNMIHILKEKVFVSLKWGDLIQLEKLGFRKLVSDLSTLSLYVTHGNNIKEPLLCQEGLVKFSALVNAPFDTEYSKSLGRHRIHFHYDDPEITCGMQHGEVVFLGYQDGKVEIRILKNYAHIAKEFNVKDFDTDPSEDLAVTGLEVCEVKNMHIVFVKTNHKLYQVLIQYPDSLLEA